MKNSLFTKLFKGDYTTEIALGSFAIGTLLFLFYSLFPHYDSIIITGIFYIVAAFFTNGITLLYLLYQLVILPKKRDAITIKILVLLSNIPITILYIYIIITLFNN